MLREIYCDKFHQKKVEFVDGFNVVLGTDSGDNSIGKSTFMLIIDFVFGGTTYSSSTDIIDNVGDHRISFKFEFDNQFFCFSRSIMDQNVVTKCDENYNPSETISINDYRKWLSEKYHLNLFELSFREAVGRYIRVYRKKNYDEDFPLHSDPKEKSSVAMISLLKLFNRYETIAALTERAKESEVKLSAYNKAQKLSFISSINKTTYKKNEKEIQRLQTEIHNLEAGLEHNLLDVDSTASEEAIHIKKDLSRAKRMRTGILSRISTLDENAIYSFSSTTDELSELSAFFPECNIKKISDIEAFHRKISTIFKTEIKAEKEELAEAQKEYDSIIAQLTEKLSQLVHNPNLSNIILQKHANAIKTIEKMQKENEAYSKHQELQEVKNSDADRLRLAKSEQYGIVEKQINFEMEKINQEIYVEKYNAPMIHFNDSTYLFRTPNDTGTGIAYKGLVVFDLAILKLTAIPILVHDSVVLKQISDDAIENITQQYINSGKQVVIALDKQQSYSEKTAKTLEKYAILKLAPNGEELFGRSWGKKS